MMHCVLSFLFVLEGVWKGIIEYMCKISQKMNAVRYVEENCIETSEDLTFCIFFLKIIRERGREVLEVVLLAII